MSFFVNINEKGASPVITLKDDTTGCEAEIFSFGALLNAFSVTNAAGKINVIDGYLSPEDAKKNITSGFKSAKLSPFVCRMNKGQYSFNNSTYKINKFYLGDSAIHGLLFDATFAVKDSGTDNEKAFVTLSYAYNKKEEGFPFSYDMEVMYVLSKDQILSLITRVTNRSETDMPLSDGWHPYFTLGNTVNDLQVQFNSKEIVQFSDGLIPTGKLFPYNTFNTFKSFGDSILDNCFLLNDTDTIACSLKDETIGVQLNIIPGAGYPFLQVYTPPYRKSIAIENLSSVPDAFNNGMGLIIAKPREQYSFATSYQIRLL